MSKLNRDFIIEQLATHFTDSIDLSDLMAYFYNGQLDYLNDLSDNEIEELAKENNIIDAD